MTESVRPARIRFVTSTLVLRGFDLRVYIYIYAFYIFNVATTPCHDHYPNLPEFPRDARDFSLVEALG